VNEHEIGLLKKLRSRYQRAPDIYRATRYWENYEDQIATEIESLDLSQVETGRHGYLATFGFGGAPYVKQRGRPSLRPRNLAKYAIRHAARHLVENDVADVLPFNLSLDDIYRLGFSRCELFAVRSKATGPREISASTFGNPQDLFYVGQKPYTIRFLDYYVRYCFAQEAINFTTEDIIVELGSGSAKQAEVLKKIFPRATLLLFDLPLQLFLGYSYVRNVFPDAVVDLDSTSRWSDLSGVEAGKIHFFGNWQFPLVGGFDFNLFWNAASFGEMEPHVVENYLSFVRGRAEWIYLMQARHGKEAGLKKGGVVRPQGFEDYCSYLPEYSLRSQRDAEAVLKPLGDSGGYFEAVWQRRSDRF
jgi:putative sugar O-methyltransferase